jgi:hypothetical protein
MSENDHPKRTSTVPLPVDRSRQPTTERPQRSGKQRIKPTIRVDGIIVHKALAVTIAEFEKVRRFVCCLGML